MYLASGGLLSTGLSVCILPSAGRSSQKCYVLVSLFSHISQYSKKCSETTQPPVLEPPVPVQESRFLAHAHFGPHFDADLASGQQHGVSGTPAFFINGRMLSGAQPFAAFKKIIDEELESIIVAEEGEDVGEAEYGVVAYLVRLERTGDQEDANERMIQAEEIGDSDYEENEEEEVNIGFGDEATKDFRTPARSERRKLIT